ncbi:MAG: glycosyltransferase family 8 protein [Treponema sp.]|nr:glycosyltransferase family 8 protein [Treponema sp.]
MSKKVYKGEIPVFFAVDYKYAPMLGVTLKSMLQNASKDYFYKIYVLTTTLSDDLQQKVAATVDGNASIEFISLKEKMDAYSNMFHLRDYYSQETYFRLFIASLYPEYDKVLYLDSDLLILDDISKMYNVDLGDNLLGAIVEETVLTINEFGEYVERALGVKRQNYFNAGIILINAKKYREEKVQEKFVKLLNRFPFHIAQDQDYLNVLCKDRVHYFDLGWNKTSFENPAFNNDDLKIVHYKMMWRPWKYDGITYGDMFWDYADQTPFAQTLRQMKETYSDEEKAKDKVLIGHMMKMCVDEANNFNNYWNTIRRERIGAGLLEFFGTAASSAKKLAKKAAGASVDGVKTLLRLA